MAKNEKDRKHSILQKNMNKCYVCGCTSNLHIHEVFYGSANRKKSIEYDCYVALCGRHHNQSKMGVHFNKELDLQLKKETQLAFEEIHNHDKFMSVFNKNYL